MEIAHARVARCRFDRAVGREASQYDRACAIGAQQQLSRESTNPLRRWAITTCSSSSRSTSSTGAAPQVPATHAADATVRHRWTNPASRLRVDRCLLGHDVDHQDARASRFLQQRPYARNRFLIAANPRSRLAGGALRVAEVVLEIDQDSSAVCPGATVACERSRYGRRLTSGCQLARRETTLSRWPESEAARAGRRLVQHGLRGSPGCVRTGWSSRPR